MVAKTDRGRIRESNQDAYFVGEMPDGTAFAVVCDGMGGTNGGHCLLYTSPSPRD